MTQLNLYACHECQHCRTLAILSWSSDEGTAEPLALLTNASDWLQIQSALGFPRLTDSATAVKHAQSLIEAFSRAQHLYKGVDEKDVGPADELPELAVNSLVTAWHLDAPTKNPTHLIQVCYCCYPLLMCMLVHRPLVWSALSRCQGNLCFSGLTQ